MAEEVIEGLKKIVHAVEASGVYKKDAERKARPKEESQLQYSLGQIRLSACMVLYLMAESELKDEKNSDAHRRFAENVREITKLFSPYVKPKTDEYFEKIFGKETVKNIHRFLAIP